jgi:hypothetical protein
MPQPCNGLAPEERADILRVRPQGALCIVYAGGPEGTGYRCAVILSELPKVASAAVTKAITIPCIS